MELSDKKGGNALDDLFHRVGTYRSGVEFQGLLEFSKRFPLVAPYNAFLLSIQKPGARYVATAADWLNIFERRIKANARPLVTLFPFGPVRFVFELEDTSGSEPFPDGLLKPFKVNGNIDNKTFSRLITNFAREGIAYSESNHGTESAGFVKGAYKEEVQTVGKRTVKVLYHIVVNQNHSMEEKFATVVHELGHLFCGHLGSYNEKLWPSRMGLSCEIEEFEAESVAWLICERAGLKNPSEKYLNGYLDEDGNIPRISIEAILKATGKTEDMMKGIVKIKKELLIASNHESVITQQALFRS